MCEASSGAKDWTGLEVDAELVARPLDRSLAEEVIHNSPEPGMSGAMITSFTVKQDSAGRWLVLGCGPSCGASLEFCVRRCTHWKLLSGRWVARVIGVIMQAIFHDAPPDGRDGWWRRGRESAGVWLGGSFRFDFSCRV